VSAKSKIAAAVALGSLFLTASEASARHANDYNNVRHVRHAVERTYGFVSRQVRRYDPRTDVYSSESLGHQSFPNPDRDFSIENLSSHAQ
jgi:Zn-dependent M28 family amino/carboxypeptidase